MFQTSSGDVSLVVDNTPANFGYIFASVEAQESPPLEGIQVIGGDSFISAMIVPDEIIPLIDEVRAEVSVSFGCPTEKQCVSLLKENGFQTKGDAWNLKPNTQDPCRGCAILLYRHVGLIYDYDSEYVCFSEKNFYGCGIFSKRCISRNNKSIRGYLIP